MFLRVAGGFLGTAIKRGYIDQAEADAWLADAAKLNEAGILTNGAVAFTATGEKPI